MEGVPFAQKVTSPEAPNPSRWVFLLHGILGQGGNLRSVARRWLTHLPHTGAVLVDLRNHGRSRHLPPPDDLDACALDLDQLSLELGVRPAAVLGHSFGGKVALHYAARLQARGEPLDRLWVLDSVLSARVVHERDAGPGSTEAIMTELAALPASFASRELFSERLEARGLPSGIVAWLAMNVVREGDTFRFGPDLTRVRAMLESYFATDLWPALAKCPARRTHIVVAERGVAFDDDERRRLDQVAREHDCVEAHLLRNSGHWVHVDAPDALDDLLASDRTF